MKPVLKRIIDSVTSLVVTGVAHFLKHSWKASPQSLRLLVVKAICKLYASPRCGDTEGDEPIYVCGAYRSNSGLGQSVRLYASRCEQQGKQVVRVDVTKQMLQQDNYPAAFAPAICLPGRGRVVIHANPPQFQLVLSHLGKKFLQNKRVVGYWSWELDSVPAIWKDALCYVDSLEVPSTFVQHALQKVTTQDVICVPHKISPPERTKNEWAKGGIIRCLFIFDAGSSWERKNPYAVVEAFKKAFSAHTAELTFKITNAAADKVKFVAFKKLCNDIAGVRILTDDISPDEMENLYLQHDIYISLHRSEGYGLTIQEALHYGLYVLATGWSGNIDFMQGERCHLVPFLSHPRFSLIPRRVRPAGRIYAVAASSILSEYTSEMPLSGIVMPYITSACSIVSFWCVIRVNWTPSNALT